MRVCARGVVIWHVPLRQGERRVPLLNTKNTELEECRKPTCRPCGLPTRSATPTARSVQGYLAHKKRPPPRTPLLEECDFLSATRWKCGNPSNLGRFRGTNFKTMLTKTLKKIVNLISFKFVPVKSEAGPFCRPKLQGFPH